MSGVFFRFIGYIGHVKLIDKYAVLTLLFQDPCLYIAYKCILIAYPKPVAVILIPISYDQHSEKNNLPRKKLTFTYRT